MTRPFRRRILYIPGYDPFPPRRYRELYRREGAEQARISGYRLDMRPGAGTGGFGWQVAGEFPQGIANSRFRVLVWDDIVQGSMGHGIAATYGQLARTAFAYLVSGALLRLMRLRRGPVLAALYPVAMLLAQALIALAAGLLIWALLRMIAAPWLALGPALAGVWAVLWMWRRADRRIFAYYLMHDYAFTARHGGAYPPALEARIAQFSETVAKALASDADEVLVIGHSSGACLAVSALADLALAGRLSGAGSRLALMTLGHVVPMVASLPRADRLRGDLAALSRSSDLFWLDVTAPGDACCFGLCDPVASAGVAPPDQRGPLVISAAFSQTLSPERRRDLRGRWFRLHFQYLCAFDRPGDYDYFAITAGPVPLAARFSGRAHSPGRITRSAGPRQ